MTPLHPFHMHCKLILLLIALLYLVNLCETEETLKFFVDQLQNVRFCGRAASVLLTSDRDAEEVKLFQGWGSLWQLELTCVHGGWRVLDRVLDGFSRFFDSALNSTTSVVKKPSDACFFAHNSFNFLYDVILLCWCLYFFIASSILLCYLPLLLLPQLSRREKISRSNDAHMLNGDFGTTSTRRRNEWNSIQVKKRHYMLASFLIIKIYIYT